MILNRILLFRQFFVNKIICKSIQSKCLSTTRKDDIKLIKDLVINQNRSDLKSGDVKKSVLLYSNEKSSFYQKLFVLNVCQTFFWIYLANVGLALSLQKHKKPTEDKQNKSFIESVEEKVENIKLLWRENNTQVLLSIALLICGQISISLFTLFTIRSVRYIILSPGARNVRITTFSVTGSPSRYRNYDIPLENVSAFQYRSSEGSYIPLKVKGRWFYFLVDSKGIFHKPSLFDQTVGVFRVLK